MRVQRAVILLTLAMVSSALPVLGATPIDVSTIGQAKQMADGAYVRITSKIASTSKVDFSFSAQYAAGTSAGTIQSSLIAEASGLAASRKNSSVLWVHNDSGDSARVFAMSTAGRHLGVYNLAGATATDWEDMALGPGPTAGVDYLYMGDIGDNNASRPSITVCRVQEPVVSSSQQPVTVDLTGVYPITMVYEDGPRDAETLMVDPVTADLYVVSKRETYSRLYRASAADIASGGTVTLRLMAQLPWGWATGGDISPSGDEIIVRGYGNASVWKRPPGSDLWNALRGTAYTAPLASEAQGEAVCYSATGQGYYTVSEGVSPPIYYFARSAPAAPSCFYLQELKGLAGLRIKPLSAVPTLLDRGKKVTVTGWLSTTADGQKQLQDASVTVLPFSPAAAKVVGLGGRNVGGGDWHYVESTKAGQKGVSGGAGLNTIGSLVRTWGKITQIEASGAYIMLDDGSGDPIRVALDGRAYNPGKFLAITGICGCYKGTDNLLHPTILVRDWQDVLSP